MTWVDWLTAIGATLGSIAFFQTAFRGIATTNKAKWVAIQRELITEERLDSAVKECRMPGHVNERTQKDLLILNNKLREKGDAWKFKSLFRDPYAKHIKVLFEVSDSMRTRLFKPEWKRHEYPNGIGAIYALEEAYFQEQYGITNAHAEQDRVRKELEQDLKDALASLTAIRTLATREDIEYLLPWTWGGR